MPQTFFTCPYNPSHVMKPLRAHRHLVECRRANPHLDFIICPFNALHHIPREMEMLHFTLCEDRLRLVYSNSVSYGEEKKVCGNLSMPPPAKIQTQGESWDE